MKNKYFYPIYKLKIKSWIKYWLIKQTEFKGVLSDILEGISFYLTDSLNMKFKMFDIIGRSVQDGDPTPENPVPIKNTGDNGSVNEEVQNKNLLNIENVGTYFGITSTKNTDGSINLKGTCTGNWFKVNNYDNVNMPAGTYTFSIDTTLEKYIRLNFVYEDNTVGTGFAILAGQKKVTQTINKKIIKLFIEFPSATNFSIDTTVKFQIEQGTTATSYVPHSEQNISFPLAEGQKLMEGDYLADDGVHHNRMQIVLDGSNDEQFDKHPDTNEIRFYTTGLGVLNGSKILCNMFTQGTKDTNPNNVRWVSTTTTLAFYSEMLDTDNMTIAQWRQYLSEHNLILEVGLAEEQTEDFTSEQKTAYPEWKKARTYKNVTHISSEDETPALLKIQYWKEA